MSASSRLSLSLTFTPSAASFLTLSSTVKSIMILLYREAATILQDASDKKGEVKNLVLNSKFKVPITWPLALALALGLGSCPWPCLLFSINNNEY